MEAEPEKSRAGHWTLDKPHCGPSWIRTYFSGRDIYGFEKDIIEFRKEGVGVAFFDH